MRVDLRWGVAVALGAVAPAALAGPMDRVLFRGLTDVTFVETDDGSRLLSENGGEPALDLNIRLWVGGDLGAGFQAIAVGRGETGKASEDGETDADLEQAYLRWSAPGQTRLTVDAGRIVTPYGNFSRRYLSSTNPLIGSPDGYGVSYPWGAVAVGAVARLDYRLAVVDLPLVNEKYVPKPGRAYRPGVELGVTPTIGLRLGAYATAGPYLGPEIEWALPAGTGWRDFEQRVAAGNLEFSRGHFSLNAEYAVSDYEVPAQADRSRGHLWFIEPAYAWTPRFFTALRLEENDYPYIMPISSFFWLGSNARFRDLETGIGWRVARGLLLKASYRFDRWDVEPALRPILPDGHAFAVQVSYGFDVLSWIEVAR